MISAIAIIGTLVFFAMLAVGLLALLWPRLTSGIGVTTRGRGAATIAAAFVILICMMVIVGTATTNSNDQSAHTSGAPSVSTSHQTPSKNCAVTSAQYARVNTGDSYSLVASIFGCPGEERSRSNIGKIDTVAYAWNGKGSLGANILIMFQNDGLITKSQFGLSE